MKKIFYFSAAIISSLTYFSDAAGQSCTTAPSCESLGYVNQASDCSASLKCPFDTSKVFCADSASFKNSIYQAMGPDWSKLTQINFCQSSTCTWSYTAPGNGIIFRNFGANSSDYTSAVKYFVVDKMNGKWLSSYRHQWIFVSKGDTLSITTKYNIITYFLPYKGF